MPVMEVTITLRVNYDTEGRKEREQITLDACKDAAQNLLATTAMIAGKRKPRIMVQCGDMISEVQHVELFEGADVSAGAAVDENDT